MLKGIINTFIGVALLVMVVGAEPSSLAGEWRCEDNGSLVTISAAGVVNVSHNGRIRTLQGAFLDGSRRLVAEDTHGSVIVVLQSETSASVYLNQPRGKKELYITRK